ncbi:3-methyladenine DNA glycosylase [Nakamurella aerolata]|uniref:3-methyladenine DNA glycosylase n=1 Tax=Nakamurella aerolata TaxID=1656892 RepID=UPI001BB13222|nr:3-methyladenine DNA glycosylase [Nakamurella aerolata]
MTNGSTRSPAGNARERIRWGADEWRPRQQQHQRRVDELTAGRRVRAAAGRRHPVDDFLFTYYSLRPGQLRRWYPGAHVELEDADERLDWGLHQRGPGGGVRVDLPAFVAARGEQVEFIGRLLTATAKRPAQLGCLGLHEWAMVYGQGRDLLRHNGYPLRLGSDGTDEVVRGHRIRCSHYDAFRFFTPAARGLNQLQPDLESRVSNEQPGCLHVGMDLYKWAYKLIPAVPSELLIDCFVLARQIRTVDMRASPYDLQALGYRPIAIETPAGKAEYVALQREFAERARPLRAELIELCAALLADT